MGSRGFSMRYILPCLSLLVIAGCQPPDTEIRSGGVGFESYSEYQNRRLAEASQRNYAQVQTVPGPVPNAAVPYPQTASAGTGAPTAAELAQAGVSGASALAVAQQQPAPVYPQTNSTTLAAAPATTVAAQPTSNVGISDEQDFSAVSSRETIESDKQRIAENRAQYQQIQPTELPERTGKIAGPQLIEYALKAPNRLGEAIYKRSGSGNGSERACARYDSPEAAQEAFLKSGGPKRDPKNLDPDGDGFACFWDPTPFQKARG